MTTENTSEKSRFSESTKLVSNAIICAKKMIEHATKIENGEIENDWSGNLKFWTDNLASLEEDLKYCTKE